MATENPRVWFKSISLENVRSFGTKQTINFTDKAGNAARWNVILGDNGTGKTTVLKGLAGAVDKNSILATTPFADSFRGTPDTNFTVKYVFEVSEGSLNKEEFFELEVPPFRAKHRILYGGILTDSTHWDPWTGAENKLLLFAYGATRKIGNSAITEDLNNQVESTLNENINLINAEEWIVQADYLAYRNQDLRRRYEIVLQILKTILKNEVSDIYISTESGIPKVFFKTHYGDVRLHELSLGYKTLIAWMVDFAKGLLDRYPDSPDPLAEPAVCLVDEIDLHLHPKFQRTIIKFLTETFLNTQFIVTAHSPLIVVAAEERPLDANIILLKREGDQTVVFNDPMDVNNWSVDQILNSDLFGHTPVRSEPLTELRTERDTLLAKPKLTKKDNARLTELDEKIGFVPFGQDQAEIKAETIIQQLADVLRKQQQVP